MTLKRLPGHALKHKSLSSLVFVIFAVFLLYCIFSSGYICTGFEPWTRLDRLCSGFKNRAHVGDLCRALCIDLGPQGHSIDSITCRGKAASGSALYNVELKGGIHLILREAAGGSNTVFHWVNNGGIEEFPREDQFVAMVAVRVRDRLNISIDSDDAKRLSVFPSGQRAPQHNSVTTGFLRALEMREIWGLLYDRGYSMGMLMHSRVILPEIVGSCGQYFAIEDLQSPLTPLLSISMDSSIESWAERVHLSLLLIDLAQTADSHGVLFCDVRPDTFGSAGSPPIWVKYTAIDWALTATVVESMINGQQCFQDNDCFVLDCTTRCHPVDRVCVGPVSRTNTQVICEKILLGWSLPGRLMIPGLLMTPQTPQALASLLRQCAQPPSDSPEVVKHTVERLLNVLGELDHSLERHRS